VVVFNCIGYVKLNGRMSANDELKRCSKHFAWRYQDLDFEPNEYEARVLTTKQHKAAGQDTILNTITNYILGFDSWQELGIFLFTTTSRTALGPTQPPIQ
jgi:hypothetical protein